MVNSLITFSSLAFLFIPLVTVLKIFKDITLMVNFYKFDKLMKLIIVFFIRKLLERDIKVSSDRVRIYFFFWTQRIGMGVVRRANWGLNSPMFVNNWEW